MTGIVALDVQASVQPPSNGAIEDALSGSNFAIPVIRFPADSDRNRNFDLGLIRGYGGGDLTVTLLFYADSASSGVARWRVRLAAITPDSDTQDIETKAFAAYTAVDKTHPGTTGQRELSVTFTITGAALDSLANGDHAWLDVQREGTHGNDTMTGDALLVGGDVTYS